MELATIDNQSVMIQDLWTRIRRQQSDLDTIRMRYHFLEETSAPKEIVTQLETKIKELEGRVSFEVASRSHAQVLIFSSLSLSMYAKIEYTITLLIDRLRPERGNFICHQHI